MANAKKGNSVNAIEERRLRPIYDFLDCNNNKRVVQECDRLLKKQPNFTCAKVLKGLGLLRLGKGHECMSIITPILNDPNIDENTIHMLTICYRELDEPEIVCKLLERTSETDVNEDVMTQCFMAQVRVNEFQKQYQTAMKLYKIYQKTPYFSWAVMSLLVKTEREADSAVSEVNLTLAERMMAKLLEENKTESEHEYCLYILILKKQKKYEKILEIMTGPNGKRLLVTSGYFHRNVIECLKENNDAATLISFLEEAITSQPDEFNFYKDYIENFTESQFERVRSFLESLNSDGTDEQKLVLSRPVLLSRLLFIKTAKDLGLDHQMNISKILTEYLTTFGNKPFFFADIKFALKLLDTKENVKAFLDTANSLMPDPILYTSADDTQRKLNGAILTRYFSSKENMTAEKILDFVQSCVKCYLDARDEQMESGSDSNSRDGLPKDDFIALAAMPLMESFWSGSPDSIWTGYFASCGNSEKNDAGMENINGERRILLEKLCAESQKNGVSNSKETDNLEKGFKDLLAQMKLTVDAISEELSSSEDPNEKRFEAVEEEFPIFLSMAVLEFVLERNPTSAQALLLLAKIYMRCGAIGAGADMLIDLDLKHVQWESLGYLFLWKLQTSGFYREANRILRKAEQFYFSSQKEIVEHVLSAYKFGSWDKILEFLEFRDSLTNSMQFALLMVEEELIHYTMYCSNQKNTLAKAQGVELEHISQEFTNFERYTDNRDLTVLLTYCDRSSLDDLQILTFNADVERLKIRSLLLSLITTFVLLPTLDTKKYKTSLMEIENLLLKLNDLGEKDYSVFDVQIPPIEGMWKPNLHRYISAGYLNLLLKFMSLNFQMANDASDEQIKSFAVQLTESVKTVSENCFKMWRLKIGSLASRADVVEDVFMYTETFGFCCILMDVCGNLLKRNKPIVKKKKKLANVDSVLHETYNFLLIILSEVAQKVETEIMSFELIKSPYPTKWAQLIDFWKGKVNNDFFNYILPFTLPSVMEKLNQSYEKSFTQMVNNIQLRQMYIEELRTQSLS